MKRKADSGIQLTMGSRYRVRSVATREQTLETTGVFRGIVSVGSIDALAMEIADPTATPPTPPSIRVIPTHTVLSIDILEAVAREEEAKDEAHMHYT